MCIDNVRVEEKQMGPTRGERQKRERRATFLVYNFYLHKDIFMQCNATYNEYMLIQKKNHWKD